MPELELEEWLKGEDVEPEADLIFIDEGAQKMLPQEGDTPDKKVFEIKVSLPSKEIKLWTMNVTSQRAVAQTYGKNTKEWVGKTVKVFVTTQPVGKVMRKVIYARIPAAVPVEEIKPAII